MLQKVTAARQPVAGARDSQKLAALLPGPDLVLPGQGARWQSVGFRSSVVRTANRNVFRPVEGAEQQCAAYMQVLLGCRGQGCFEGAYETAEKRRSKATC